jgi:hypothetical protein
MCRLLKPVTLVACFLCFGNAARAQDDARAILDKAIQARGGEANLARLKAFRTKAKGTLDLPMLGATEFTGEAFFQAPDKQRSNIELQAQGQTFAVVGVFDGTRGWRSLNGMTMEITGADLVTMKTSVYAQYISTLLPLKDKQYELTKLEEIKVDGKPAVGFKVTAKDRPEVKFYFDKDSGLMVKGERMTVDRQTGMEVLSETFITEWKEVKGIKFPMKSHIMRMGKKVEESQTTELEYMDKLDDKLFMKP